MVFQAIIQEDKDISAAEGKLPCIITSPQHPHSVNDGLLMHDEPCLLLAGIKLLTSALRELSKSSPSEGTVTTQGVGGLSQRVTEDVMDWMELSQGLERDACEQVLVRLNKMLASTAIKCSHPAPDLHSLNYQKLRDFVRDNFLLLNEVAAADPADDEALVMLSEYLGIEDGMMDAEDDEGAGPDSFMDVDGNDDGRWLDSEFRSRFVSWVSIKYDMDEDTCLPQLEELELALLPHLQNGRGPTPGTYLVADQLRAFLLENGEVANAIEKNGGDSVLASYQRLCRYLGLPVPGAEKEVANNSEAPTSTAQPAEGEWVTEGTQEGGEQHKPKEEEEVTALPSATLTSFMRYLSKRQKIRPGTVKEYQRYAETTMREMMRGTDGSFKPLPSRIEVSHSPCLSMSRNGFSWWRFTQCPCLMAGRWWIGCKSIWKRSANRSSSSGTIKRRIK